MNTTATAHPLHDRLGRLLAARQSELQSQLHAAFGTEEDQASVTDFKDLAAEEAASAVDEVARTRAARELDEVAAALQRLADGSYGTCLDCGEPIAESRLLALPATAFCTACQASRESAAAAARR